MIHPHVFGLLVVIGTLVFGFDFLVSTVLEKVVVVVPRVLTSLDFGPLIDITLALVSVVVVVPYTGCVVPPVLITVVLGYFF